MHALGGPAAGSQRVVAVLRPHVLLLHRAGAAGGGSVRAAGAAGVLLGRLRSRDTDGGSDLGPPGPEAETTPEAHVFLGVDLKVAVAAWVALLHVVVAAGNRKGGSRQAAGCPPPPPRCPSYLSSFSLLLTSRLACRSMTEVLVLVFFQL